MSTVFDGTFYDLFPDVAEIHLSNRMPEDCDPTAFHRSMLDAVNEEARACGWRGVTLAHAGWNKDTRILSLCCLPGDMPATLHFLKKVVAAQKAYVLLDGGRAE